MKNSINKEIMRLTLPTVLSNITVPLLGMCDTAVSGHMADEKYLAGVSLGSVMLTSVYWLFNFLRAGTSGITATAFGAKDSRGMGLSLLRSASLAILLGVLLTLLHSPLLNLLLKVMGASADATELSARYFRIGVWGAVPMMLLMAISGWLTGMQSTKTAMTINIGLAALNVCATLTAVYALKVGFDGIPAGTVTAQWLILIPAIWLTLRIARKNSVKFRSSCREFFAKQQWGRIFNVNSNLFFRSACMIAATMILSAYGARLGDVVVGSNAIINQLYLFFSYFMDGFAFTGEALVGRFCGAKDSNMLRLSIRSLLKWTVGITAIFVIIYSLLLPEIAGMMSDSTQVCRSVLDCRIWVVGIPLAGALAFIYDGFYVGLTRTRTMLVSTIAGVGLFSLLLVIVPHTQWMLWMAFTCYLALRSAILTLSFPRKSLITNY